MKPSKPGQIVKFRKPLEDENPNDQYVILELADDANAHRAKIRALGYDNPFIPVNTVNLDDIEVVAVDTNEMLAETVDILKENGEYATGRVLKAEQEMIFLEMTREKEAIVTNVRLTVKDLDGKEHQGRYVYRGKAWQKMKKEKNQSLREYLAQTMKDFRKRKNFTQADLAKLLDVNRTTVSKIENCKFSISLDYLELLSERMKFIVIIEQEEG